LGLKPHQKPLKDEELYYPTNIPSLERYFSTKLGDMVADLRVNPQTINPLTGLDRFNRSVVVASPKLMFKVLPKGAGGIRYLAATGTISLPNYRMTERTGQIATKAHQQGAVVVQVIGGEIFKVTPLEIRDGAFLFEGQVYGKHALQQPRSILVLGDLHLPVPASDEAKHLDTCAYVTQTVLEYQPTVLVLHDILSFDSISHHNANSPFTRPAHSVADEIDSFVRFVEAYADGSSVKEFVLVSSNHDNHLWRYIQEGRFLKDAQNVAVCLEILKHRHEECPVLSYIVSRLSPKVTIATGKTPCVLQGYDISQHGDKFDYGTRGSVDKFAKCGSPYPMIIGHSHRPTIVGDVWSVGVCSPRQGYEGGIHSGCRASILIKQGLRCFV